MTKLSYHASHEQFAPGHLVQLVQQAESAGFDAAFCSDHLQPWGPAQGESGFSWSWLGAALQATRRLSFGTITVPCGWRYHPVVLAQAIATLGCMFPGRLPWIALGSGEALNEWPVTGTWPPKEERQHRLQEGASIIKSLLAGERVSSHGAIKVDDARLWSRPALPTRLVGAATSAETARWLGGWADGLLTVAPSLAQLEEIIGAFREGGGAGKPVHVKLDLCWASSDEEALTQAHAQWRFNAVDRKQRDDLRQPEDFDRASGAITLQQMADHVFVTSDLTRHAEHLASVLRLGVDTVDLHHVGTSQEAFIRQFGANVLPAVRSRQGS